MKTTFNIVHSVTDLDNDLPLLYFKSGYFNSQQHETLICYENNKFFFPLSNDGQTAISIPRSPFGSFFKKEECTLNEFESFFSNLKDDLHKRQIETLKVTHPSMIYDSFIEEEWFHKVGFQENYSDFNQHIDLKNELNLHKMQERKLETLNREGFTFQKLPTEQLKTAHQFVKVCRMAQGLEINIPFETLNQLFQETKSYDIFAVIRDEKISALCISARVTDKVAYYYLSATSPMFRNQSPMVLLIKGMVDYYRDEGFETLDLGVSSVMGKPQETLILFKERMGGMETTKKTFQLSL